MPARRGGSGPALLSAVSELRREISIDAEPGRVYDVLCDPDCLGEWVTIQDGLEQAPNGDLEQGSKLVQRLKVAGQRFRVTWTVDEARRPQRVEWSGKGPMGSTAHAIYELEAVDSGTSFRYLNRWQLPGGPAGRILGRALNAVSGREADRSLERLKQLIERG